MFLGIETIQEQNAIALSLLSHILKDEPTKNLLLKFGRSLSENILRPLLIYKLARVNAVNDLNQETQNAVYRLATQHSIDERQYDSLRSQYTAEEIKKYEALVGLLNEMDYVLTSESSFIDIQSMARFFKCMYDISGIYEQGLVSLHDKTFKEIDSIIMPTQAEFGCRISFSELNNKQFARTFGLFAKANDLIDGNKVNQQTSVTKARSAGKSFHSEISTKRRYRSVFTEYLRLKENFAIAIDAQNKAEIEVLLVAQIQKMINLDIPLDYTNEDINKVDELAHVNETWIEKISKTTNAPLVAGVSGTTSRLLSVLIYFNLIHSNDKSIEELQKLVNCVAAHMILQGHHSIIEVHEVGLRAIDALHIVHDIRTEGFCTQSSFYSLGGIETFFHADYLSIIEKAEEYLSIANDMPTTYRQLSF